VYPLIPRQDQFEVEFFQVPIEGRPKVMSFRWPRISSPVLGRIFAMALLGTGIAGTNQVLHDRNDYHDLARVFYEVQDPSIPLSWRGIRITNLGRENRLPGNLVGRIFCGVVYGPDLGFQTLFSIGIFIQPEGIFLFSWALLLADYSDF
jgi:hypothetical protein